MIKKTILAFFVCSTLLSCGGGGGGGSDSSADGTSAGARCSAGNPAIRLVHAGVDSGPVDIYSATALAGSRRYGLNNVYLSLADGSGIRMQERVDNQVIFNGNFSTAAASCQTYVFTGSKENGNLNVSIVNDIPLALEDGQAGIRILNASSQDSQYTLTVAGANATANDGSASDYLAVPAGTTTAQITGPSSFAKTITLNGGAHHSFIIRGDTGFLLESELVRDDIS